MENQYVIFSLAGEAFAVDISRVESIIKMQTITRMPQTPWFVEGVTNLRGKILPVVDLRRRLELPTAEATKESRIVVVVIGSLQAGMVVDEVTEVLSIASDTIEPPPALAVSGVNATFITGIAKLPTSDGQNRLAIILDLTRVLTAEEQSQIAQF